MHTCNTNKKSFTKTFVNIAVQTWTLRASIAFCSDAHGLESDTAGFSHTDARRDAVQRNQSEMKHTLMRRCFVKRWRCLDRNCYLVDVFPLRTPMPLACHVALCRFLASSTASACIATHAICNTFRCAQVLQRRCTRAG
jgi:hypothetical protein